MAEAVQKDSATDHAAVATGGQAEPTQDQSPTAFFCFACFVFVHSFQESNYIGRVKLACLRITKSLTHLRAWVWALNHVEQLFCTNGNAQFFVLRTHYNFLYLLFPGLVADSLFGGFVNVSLLVVGFIIFNGFLNFQFKILPFNFFTGYNTYVGFATL